MVGMSEPGSQWWQPLNTGFAAPGEGVGSPKPRVWLSPTALHSCKLAWGSRVPVACRGMLPVRSCLCGPASEYCSAPSRGWRVAGEPTGTASCWASSCLRLRGPGQASVLLVGGLHVVGASAPSTIVLPVGTPAKRIGEGGGGGGVRWGDGGGWGWSVRPWRDAEPCCRVLHGLSWPQDRFSPLSPATVELCRGIAQSRHPLQGLCHASPQS